MKVLKFGGTSVGSAEACLRASRIVAGELLRGGVVVVSALAGTTDLLGEACTAAGQGRSDAARELCAKVQARHRLQACALGLEAALEADWAPLFARLEALVEGMGLLWEASPRARDAALSIGETLSAHLMAALLRAGGRRAAFRDVRALMATDARYGRARVDLDALRVAAPAWREDLDEGRVLVTQGFLGRAPDGSATTLGRGGSDTSATLLGEALGAEEVQIWTDVDGVLSADPSLVPGARPLPAMSLREAAALSAFGAKVLHGDALAPVARAGLRLVVANTRRPEASRTLVRRQGPPRRAGEVSSVAYKEGLRVLRFPAEADPGELLLAAQRLQDAGATRYGLVSTPEGGLLVLRPETPAAAGLLEELARRGLSVESGWALVALVGEGLALSKGRVLGLLEGLREEPVAAVLAGDTGISVAVLVPETRLKDLIPRLHARYVESTLKEELA